MDKVKLRSWVSRAVGHHAEISLSPSEVLSLLDEIDKLDADLSKAIEERDLREGQIDEIADALGDSSEWSNLNDRGVNALEQVSKLSSDFLAVSTDYAKLLDIQGQAGYDLKRLKAVLKWSRILRSLKFDSVQTATKLSFALDICSDIETPE